MTSARLAAARVLLAVDAGSTTLAAELERARAGLDDRRDRALLVELAAGTLRWRGALDAVIEAASHRAIADIDPRVRTVLRLALYQLRYLERVPDHAVVHDAVEVVRTLRAPRAAGFVNAVLRTVQRKGTTFALPTRPADSAIRSSKFQSSQFDVEALRYLSATLSHPEWLVRRWLERYGFEAAERWCLFNNTPPTVTVRSAGRLALDEIATRLRANGIDATAARFVHDALQLPAGSLGRVPPDLRDEIAVQDEGSQLVARAVAATPGERVVDLCAAPGGKTLVLAADMLLRETPHASLLVACDKRPSRVRLLARTLRNADVPLPVVALDAARALPFGPVFDRVLLDAPCSGLGTIRRDPDLKWTRSPDDLPRLVETQRAMLAQAAELVRPGGHLIYATCSSEPEENDAIVDAFLTATPGFAVAQPPLPAEVVGADGRLRTLPFRHELDAFFAAVLVRRGTA